MPQKPVFERYFDACIQAPVFEWPHGLCARCGDDEGFFYDADGAHKCRECGARFCAECGVKMSVHISCVVTD